MSKYPAQTHIKKTLQELAKISPASSSPHVLLLVGEKTQYRHDTDRELSFRQESNFVYLTGCAVPSSVVLVEGSPGASVSSTLFIPPVSESDIMWSVSPPSLAIAKETYDATVVRHTTDLIATIQALPADTTIHVLPNTPLYPTPPSDLRLILATRKMDDRHLLPALQEARIVKTPEEVELIRRANAISSRAHECVMRTLGLAVKTKIKEGSAGSVKLPSEWLVNSEAEAEALFVASCRREGSVHQAYLPIVAGARRAATLHYCCNDRSLAWGPVGSKDHLSTHNELTGSQLHLAHGPTGQHGPANGDDETGKAVHAQTDAAGQVLLIDAGCEWECYASDITRTMPVGNGGKFTKEAGEIYDLVHSMQQAAFAALKPGVHWDSCHLAAHRALVRGFLRLGIFKVPAEAHASANGAASGLNMSPPSATTSKPPNGGIPGTDDPAPNAFKESTIDAIIKSGITRPFFPHGLGHSLGMDVHDVPGASKPASHPVGTLKENHSAGVNELGPDELYSFLRLRRVIVPGMVVTVEPGCYFHAHLLEAAEVKENSWVDADVLAKYEGVGGVRIEDVVVITEGGMGWENLTTVPSDRKVIEALCSGA